MRKIIAIALVVVLAGCATPARKIGATYVSPMTFNGYSCQQLVAETYRIGSRVSELGANVDRQATQDKWAMGVGLFLFWPALFMVDGNEGVQSEYARLKGEYEAVQEAAIAQGCTGGQQVPMSTSAAPLPQYPASTPGQRQELDPAKRCDACQRLLGNPQ